MDQLIYAYLSHTHYWYEVGMLKVPADLTQHCTHSPNMTIGVQADYYTVGEFDKV